MKKSPGRTIRIRRRPADGGYGSPSGGHLARRFAIGTDSCWQTGMIGGRDAHSSFSVHRLSAISQPKREQQLRGLEQSIPVRALEGMGGVHIRAEQLHVMDDNHSRSA